MNIGMLVYKNGLMFVYISIKLRYYEFHMVQKCLI